MSKEKSITDLRDERKTILSRAQDTVAKAKAESRTLTDAEQKEVNEARMRATELELEIEQRKNLLTILPSKNNRKESFSMRRALLAHLRGDSQHDVEAEAIQQATEHHSRSVSDLSLTGGELVLPMNIEKRASGYNATAEGATGVVVSEDQQEMLLPLQSNLVLAKAGARMMTGLRGNIYWPSHSDVSVFWEGENDAAQDGKGKFSKGTVYAPKRLTAYVSISEQLLIQENFSVEAFIRQRFAEAIAQKIEKTAFSKDAHADNVPDGLFQVAPTAVAGSMDWANIVAMETKADLANALMGNLAYVMHPALIGKAKTKVKDTSGAGGFIFQGNGDGMLNGYKALRTNNLPSGLQAGEDEYGIIFGNWADYFVGQWGALVIKADPYTKLKNGEIELVVNSYWNMGCIRSESFCIGSMK